MSLTFAKLGRDPPMTTKAHSWAFRSRFRAGAFGWRSDLPIKRIKEAVSEIKAAARKDMALGAEGAVVFLERVSSALEHVDSSSGAIGATVNHAVETLVPIIAQAPANESLRNKWLERLWRAVEDDATPTSSCSLITGANSASRPSARRDGQTA